MTTIKKQRSLFGKLQFCGGEKLPWGCTEAQREMLMREIRIKHPAAHFDKQDRQVVLYGVWTPATPKQQARYELKRARAKERQAAKLVRIAKLKEADFNRLVTKATKLGYELVPLAK